MPNTILAQKELKEALHYNPETGVFTWVKLKGTSNRRIGGVAGGFCRTHGYIIIKIDGIGYKAHRLAWLYMYGVWPNFIDHKNHNRSDNRIVNLRSVTNQENCKNASLRKDSSSRVCGVHWNKLERKWKAQINVDSKRIYLGCFDDLFEACCVRKSAENKHGFHLNHGC